MVESRAELKRTVSVAGGEKPARVARSVGDIRKRVEGEWNALTPGGILVYGGGRGGKREEGEAARGPKRRELSDLQFPSHSLYTIYLRSTAAFFFRSPAYTSLAEKSEIKSRDHLI